MSGHAEDPVAEESKRFFTFFNLSMALAAITGIEIVIIYVKAFDGASVIAVLFTTSVLKFIGVVWWFMHLRWDKFLNTILFLLGLVIAAGTYFAVIYMSDVHPEIRNFEVNPIKDEWKPNQSYAKGEYVLREGAHFVANFDHQSAEVFSESVGDGDEERVAWSKIEKIPHRFSWSVSHADLVEINSKNGDNAFFHLVHPAETENVEGKKVFLLNREATTDEFRLKARSEAYWTENQ